MRKMDSRRMGRGYVYMLAPQLSDRALPQPPKLTTLRLGNSSIQTLR
jgi:hypothetical protein